MPADESFNLRLIRIAEHKQIEPDGVLKAAPPPSAMSRAASATSHAMARVTLTLGMFALAAVGVAIVAQNSEFGQSLVAHMANTSQEISRPGG